MYFFFQDRCIEYGIQKSTSGWAAKCYLKSTRSANKCARVVHAVTAARGGGQGDSREAVTNMSR